MDSKHILSCFYLLGQVIEVIGGVLLYKYGVSKHVQALSGAWLGTGANTAQEFADNKRYKKLSKIGLALFLVGVCLQLPISIYNCIT